MATPLRNMAGLLFLSGCLIVVQYASVTYGQQNQLRFLNAVRTNNTTQSRQRRQGYNRPPPSYEAGNYGRQPPAPVAPPPAPQVPPAGAPRPYAAPFSPSQPQAFPAQAPVFRPPGFTPPPSAPLAPAFFMGSQTVAPAPPASQPESPAYNIPAPGPPPVAPSRLPPQAPRAVAQPPQQPSAPHRYNSVFALGHTPGSGVLIGGRLSSTAGRQPLPRFPQQVEGGKNGRSRGLTPQTAGVFRPGPAGSELGAPGAQEAHKYYYPPRMPLPLPTCFHNPTGYPCCNPALNDLMVETYTELEARPKFHTCNINAIATALQNKAQEKFNTSFETIAAFDDFAQKIHFNGDLVCKVELGGKYMLAYGTVRDAASFVPPDSGEQPAGRRRRSSIVGPENEVPKTDVSHRYSMWI